jgi:Holliday junction DNA helicase RuvA
MIALIEGILIEATPLEALILVNGLGYAVSIPVTTAEKLPPTGQRVRLHTHAVYREDSQALYGFSGREERDFFRILTEKVSGIGPKTAISILSGLSLESLKAALRAGDVATLAKCHGIGKKTAERLCLELKDVVGAAGPATAGAGSGAGLPGGGSALPVSRAGDAMAALVTLGFKADAADRAVRRAMEKVAEDASTEEIIRAALR